MPGHPSIHHTCILIFWHCSCLYPDLCFTPSPALQSSTAEMMARSRQLAGLGNIAAKDGHFSEAVRRFTEAIDLYPFDHRSEHVDCGSAL